MHINRSFPARKFIVGLVAATVLTLLPGCETVRLTNLTAPTTPENPSQIYTFQLRVTPRTNTVAQSSITPHIVIDGQSHDMRPSPMGEGLYDFEYQVGAGRDEVAYYYLVTYNTEGNNVATPGEAYTEVYKLKIASRNVLPLDVNRGPVGARISVLGRGFTSQDVIVFDGQAARTVMESPNALSFFVPALPANRNYRVFLQSAGGTSSVGTFRIDPSSVMVSPPSLNLLSGVRQPLTFTLPNPAPSGGTLLDIATDIPESVIMPEVIVPQGQTSVTVEVEGGKSGTGSLYLRGFGAGEITIPVTVSGR
jgi:hypothetical protein